MRRGLRAVCLALCLAGLGACSNTTEPLDPASFERPNRVALLCVEKQYVDSDVERALVPMANCTPPNEDVDEDDLAYTVRALVTQSGRGQVAGVDLDDLRAIDTRQDIPGATFVAVGEFPVAIAVPRDKPQTTYVANAGSRDISVLRTSVFMRTGVGTDYSGRVSLPGVPIDLLVTPAGDALFVTLSDSDELLRVPIQDDGALDVAGAVRVPIEGSWSKLPSTDTQAEATPTSQTYVWQCSAYAPVLPNDDTPVELAEPSADPGAPQPAGMALDESNNRLLVADKRQGIIHTLDLGRLASADLDAAVLTPIRTGVPTERVAVTPPVPKTIDANAELTQYVYAIDAQDGSVLVAEDGHAIHVGVAPGKRTDRLELGASGYVTGTATAVSIAALDIAYDPANPWADWPADGELPDVTDSKYCLDSSHEERSAARLRGVFLAVGLSDGTVRIVDVHDNELLHCRDRNVDACDPSVLPSSRTNGFDPVPVVRHRARINYTYASDEAGSVPRLAPWVSPRFSDSSAQLSSTGRGTQQPGGLACVQCGEDQTASFPILDDPNTYTAGDDVAGTLATLADCSAGEARVCSLADPTVESQDWSAMYQAPIPGTAGGRARVSDQADVIEVDDVDFCAAGVLGYLDDNVGLNCNGSTAESQCDQFGDQLQFTGELPTDELLAATGRAPLGDKRSACEALIAARDDDDIPIAFRIRRAYQNKLEIESTRIVLLGETEAQTIASLSDVLECFGGDQLAFQVNTFGAFIVRSSESSEFVHDVQRNAEDQHCERGGGAAQQSVRLSRLRPDEVFDNGVIRFQIEQPSEGAYEPLTQLTLSSSSYRQAPKLWFDGNNTSGTATALGVLPVDMVFNPQRRTLYVVDITTRGLVPITFDPMPAALSVYSVVR